MRKSAQKQQSQVQPIQRTVTSRNVTKDNSNKSSVSLSVTPHLMSQQAT